MALVVVALAGGVLAGCGGEDPPVACETSYLTYDNFGAPFVLDWCRGCHSAALPNDMRQDAPVDVNFDTRAEVRAWSHRIVDLAGARTAMPPAGGPTATERALLVEWLTCGAP